MRIGMFLSYREHIITSAPLYHRLRRRGHKLNLYDVLEESGWFEKGLQYISLEFDRAKTSIDPNKGNSEIRDELQRVLERDKLDLILIQGYSPFFFKLVIEAKNMGIPVVHVGSGLRRYDSSKDDILRQLIDHFTVFHATYLPKHTKNLIQEGVDPEYIKLTGYPLIDVVFQYMDVARNRSFILDELDVEENDYVVVEIGYRNTLNFLDEFKRFADNVGEFLIFPLSKSLKKFLSVREDYLEIMEKHDILFIEILDYMDHLNLLYSSKSVITDEEWIALEASVLGKPSVLLSSDGEALIVDNNFLEIVPLKKGFEEILKYVYLRNLGNDVTNLFGGGAASEMLSEFIEEVLEKPIKYPPLSLFELNEESYLMKLSFESVPDDLRSLVDIL